MTWVALRAVEGGSRYRIGWASGLGVAPGHWWPAPAIVSSSTVWPAGQTAAETVTAPVILITGAAQVGATLADDSRQGTQIPFARRYPCGHDTPGSLSLLVDLKDQVRCDGISFESFDSARRTSLLTLLRPHLRQAYLDAERRRQPLPRLTPRHRQLLDLLAAGHTNAAIARRLGLSEGTVRTHLEHLYRRLQVSSRTEAVTRAFRDHYPAAGFAEGREPQKR